MRGIKKLITGILSGVLVLSLCQCKNPEPQPIPAPSPTPPTPEKPVQKEKKKSVDYYLPVLDFGRLLAEVDWSQWEKDNGAEQVSETENKRVYKVNSTKFPKLEIIISKGVYQEAILYPKTAAICDAPEFIEFLSRKSFRIMEKGVKCWKGKKLLFADLEKHSETESALHIYKVHEKVIPFVPFLDFGGKEFSRRELTKDLESKGFKYEEDKSTSYKRVFKTPYEGFPFMIIMISKQTEKPKQTLIEAESKFYIKSPSVEQFYLQNEFVKHNYYRDLYPVLYCPSKEVRLDIRYPMSAKMRGGFLSFTPMENPNKKIEVQQMPHPIYAWGKTWEEVMKLEQDRGNKGVDFMGVLNVATGDVYFPTIAYFFRGNPKVLTEIELPVKNTTIIPSESFKALMQREGFTFLRYNKDKETYSYWHETKPVVAIAKAKGSKHTITFRPKPTSN